MPISSILGAIYFLTEVSLGLFKRAKSGSVDVQDRGSLRVALSGAFGDRYRQYMQRTWRLIPGLY
ncbi:MAG TPA: hypothetical protein VGG49_08090 [Steroidobacteraceae bacterium]